MRSGVIAGLVWLAAVAAAGAVRADDTPQTSSPEPHKACEVPGTFLTTESQLHKVADAVRAGHPLDILVVGSRSSTIPGSEASGYPARMQAALKDVLPQVTVNVALEIHPKRTAEDIASGLVKLVEAKKPTLVIWQTGTVDALRSVDPDDFRNAVDEGVTALQNAGTDVILMNPQYSPRTEMMISVPPYVDSMRAVAQQHDVPLFDRFAIMHQWNDQGDFDLFSASPGVELAKRVHDCLGQALAKFVVDAAHVGPAQQN